MRAVLVRVPGIAWVVLFITCLLAGGTCATYRHGVRTGELAVRRAAVVDSTQRATRRVAIAAGTTDSSVRVVRAARTSSDAGRRALDGTRARALAVLAAAPAPVIAHVEALERQVVRDSLTIAVHAAGLDAAIAERAEREQLDSLRVRAVELEARAPGRALPIAIVAGTTAAVLTLLYFLR